MESEGFFSLCNTPVPAVMRWDIIPGRMMEPRSHVVLVFQFSFQDVGDNFHVPVGMGVKTFLGLDPVLVDNPQDAEAAVLGSS